MDEPVEGSRMSSDPPTEVVASDSNRFEVTRGSRVWVFNHDEDRLWVSVYTHGVLTVTWPIHADTATALTRWLQARIAEM
jgi:hypothetical protein